MWRLKLVLDIFVVQNQSLESSQNNNPKKNQVESPILHNNLEA